MNRRDDFESAFKTKIDETWEGAKRRAQEIENATIDGIPESLQFAPRGALSGIVDKLSSKFQMPDLGLNPSAEFVRYASQMFLATTDVKARALDSLGVRSMGNSWTNPVPLREHRHDSAATLRLGELYAAYCLTWHQTTFSTVITTITRGRGRNT